MIKPLTSQEREAIRIYATTGNSSVLPADLRNLFQSVNATLNDKDVRTGPIYDPNYFLTFITNWPRPHCEHKWEAKATGVIMCAKCDSVME